MPKISGFLISGALIISFVLSPGMAKDIELIGAGATFPYPFYSKVFGIYHQEFGVKVNYQAIGSGGGTRQLLNKTVDFGGTDALMSDEEVKTEDNYILYVPTCLGAVVLTYNLPGNPGLKFTPEFIAGIFLGKITKWNDERIVAVNPEVALPDMNIIVARRSDGSGTTFIFSSYLGKVSGEWNQKVGVGTSLNWPVGLGAKGNPGVTGLIRQIPGSIGYVELIYALQNNLPVALVENKSGNFIQPTIESVSLAANVDLPEHTRASISNTEAEYGYPISGFTWIILYKEQNYARRTREKAEELVRLLWWVIHEGQKFAEPLHYAPIPESAVKKAEEIIKSVTYNGKALLQ
ncbi:phosphate ABC transporter substrate-binding protein PstS [Candidatus Aerophobetes bacterium]|nr:phosphate ABC transporter substrate-binding protein PstS [Candidatus Aerophobetes bacterium]